MNVVTILSIVVILTLLAGALIAAIIALFSRSVAQAQAAVNDNQNQTSFDLKLTLDHPISVSADKEVQMREARKLAAQRAANLPRGANMRIGRKGAETLMTARQGVAEDPLTAVRIAAVHGWNLLHVQSPWLIQEEAPAAAATPAAAPTKSPDDLVPGEDYPFIEITDDMSPEEVRKARVANAKAKAAAVKALKEAAESAPAGGNGAAAPATKSAPSAGAPAGAPVAGQDYEEIEITDDMSPEEVRKARIANAKAKAAAAKAMKAAGGAPAAETQAQPEAASSAPAAPQEESVQVPSDIPEPDYIEITDDMSPDEVRKARINNAKAKSAYHKALKEAGIDPATVKA